MTAGNTLPVRPGRLSRLLATTFAALAFSGAVYLEAAKASGGERLEDGASAAAVDAPATVPDVEGMSLREASRALKAAGLRVIVRDEYGETIERDVWREFRVRKQTIAAGAVVDPGTWVRLVGRWRYENAQGY